MEYNQFIKHVQTAAQLDSRDAAIKATQAVLETVRERILGNECAQLAAQLAPELQQYLRGREGEMGDHFPIEEFYQRICNKAGVDADQAAIYARAVFSTLNAAVTAGEFADVRSNFSQDYDEIFATGTTA